MARSSERYKRGLTFEEVALVKAMDRRGMARDLIMSYISKPGRVVSPAVVQELGSSVRENHIPAASDVEVERFMALSHSEAARKSSLSGADPLSPTSVAAAILSDRGDTALPGFESSTIDYKSQSLSKDERAALGRAAAGLANSRGGYIIVGINDDRTICGIQEEMYDQTFLDHVGEAMGVFFPRIDWRAKLVVMDGKSLFVVHVMESEKKPIVSTRDYTNAIREAVIYYRYPGKTSAIRAEDLIGLLQERDKLVKSLAQAGVEAAA